MESGGFEPYENFDGAVLWHPGILQLDVEHYMDAYPEAEKQRLAAADKERLTQADVLVDFSAAQSGDELFMTMPHPRKSEDEPMDVLAYRLTRSDLGANEWYGVFGGNLLSVRLHGASTPDGNHWEEGLIKQYEGLKLSLVGLTRQLPKDPNRYSDWAQLPETLPERAQEAYRARGQIIDGPGNVPHWRIPQQEGRVLSPIIDAWIVQPTVDDVV